MFLHSRVFLFSACPGQPWDRNLTSQHSHLAEAEIFSTILLLPFWLVALLMQVRNGGWRNQNAGFWFPIPPFPQCMMGTPLGGQVAHLRKQRFLEMLGTEVETPSSSVYQLRDFGQVALSFGTSTLSLENWGLNVCFITEVW